MIRGLFVPWKAELFSSLFRNKAEAVKQRVSKPGRKCHQKVKNSYVQISQRKIQR